MCKFPPMKDSVGECKKYWNDTMQGKSWQREKEESHVDVSTRVGSHSRGNSASGTSSVPERNIGNAITRYARGTVPGRAFWDALPSGRAARLRALATSDSHGVAICRRSDRSTSCRCSS